MKYLKNKAVRNGLIIHLALTAVMTVAGCFTGAVCAAILFASGVIFTCLWYLDTARRYRDIAELSDTLDRILSGEEKILPSDSDEGELAILKSEIHKVTVRLCEKAGELERDRHRLSEAITDISHQLRTPLTAMNLDVSMLCRDEVEPDARIALARDLKKSLAKTEWLIETLLKLSRLDAGAVDFDKKPVPVGGLIQQVSGAFTVGMELKSVTLLTDIRGESFTGDRLWCSEAFGNLFKNCLEHTPEGGFIEIRAVENALYTEITVRDSGGGFDSADIPHLFERFYKGRRAPEGSVGIGLALAKTIIEAQGGRITASNHPSGGAVFTVRFNKSAI